MATIQFVGLNSKPSNKYNNIDYCPEAQMDEHQYQPKEVVWAKITGYPWWPAQVGEASKAELDHHQNKVKVFFFGDNSHAFLAPHKLAKYQASYEMFQHKAVRNNRLRESIEMANECCENGYPTGSSNNPEVRDDDSMRLEEASQLCAAPRSGLPPSDKPESTPEHSVIITSQKNQLFDIDSVIIEEHNVVQLLQQGIVAQVSKSSFDPLRSQQINQQLQSALLKHYRLDTIIPFSSQPGPCPPQQPRRYPPKKGRRYISKPRTKKQSRQSASLSQTERKCIIKLYGLLKLKGVSRDQARELSVDFVRNLEVKWEGLTKEFRGAFREHLARLHVLMGLKQSAKTFPAVMQRACAFKLLERDDKMEDEVSTTRHSENHLVSELDE